MVLRAKAKQKLGSRTFYKNEPVLYFDTLKTSSLEGAATTVYAQGGRGNTRLVAWEGERTLTFTMEDALLSMESFSILSGAGLIDASAAEPIYVHQTSQVELKATNEIVLPDEACWNGEAVKEDAAHYHQAADIFIMPLDDGEVNSEPRIPARVTYDTEKHTTTIMSCPNDGDLPVGTVVLVDYYVKKIGGAAMIEITADKFGGNYYLEASTLFRRESDGVDMPAEFIIPNCKVQSNFTFSLAATGDPSTFTFTMDAFPDYTKFDKTHKVLAAIQVIYGDESGEDNAKRECGSTFKTTATSSAEGATVKVTGETNTTCDISVTGNAVKDNAQTNNEFNLNDELVGVSAMVLNIPLQVTEDGNYHIKQVNPALEYYYPTDNRVSKVGTEYIKEADYDLTKGEVLSLLVTENKTPITVVLSQGDKTIKTYTITSNVTFA